MRVETPNLRFREPPSHWRKWLRIGRYAGYVACLLLLAWLYAQQQEVGRSKETHPSSPPAVSTDRSSRDERTIPREISEDRRIDRNRNATSGKRREEDAPRTGDDQERTREGSLVARNVRITNENGHIVYRGDVDVSSTIKRIDQGKRLRFSHDGIVFENRERRLPIRPSGYYREFIHPTKGESGPGGQRIVIGKNGEAYYSPDHYRTFQRIR